jgi:hypothetical protein
LFFAHVIELWTGRRLAVDGSASGLHGFGKSHHFIPATSVRPDHALLRSTGHRRVSACHMRIRHIQSEGRDGMAMLEGIFDSRNNPLEAVEDIAASNDLVFERSGEDEITISAKGQWTDYTLSFTWMSEIEALHLACVFDMKVPSARRGETQRLIAAINEQLWVGHFDIWTHTGTIMYRQALVLPGGLSATSAQCETMLISSISACERYYPAIQFTVWAGKTASEAMSAAMFDTEGEA